MPGDEDQPTEDQNTAQAELTITATAHAVHPEGAEVPQPEEDS